MTFDKTAAFRYLLCIVYYIDITSSQFPNHVDFQRVDNIVLNDQNYTLLKPTVHLVTDYFKEFVQKRHNTNLPSKRIFMDENGFRHFWKGMEIPNPKSLRKADHSSIIKEGLNNETKLETVVTKSIAITEATDKESTDDITIGTTIKKTPRRRKRRPTNNIYTASLRQGRAGDSVITTSFFCPFFGVITMTLNTDEL